MKSLQILAVIVLTNVVYGSNQFNEADGSVLLASLEQLYKETDPEIKKVFARNVVPNITVYPRTCAESTDPRSGVNVIHPQPGFGEPFQAFCDQDYDGGGWTVIQNRIDGSQLFYQNWKAYEEGFGNLNGEFWLGLRKIHELTNSKRHELMVLLEDRQGYTAYARYDHFLIASPTAKYELFRLGNYSGSAGDSLQFHLGLKFSTFDDDNGTGRTRNCAQYYHSAWWYQNCFNNDLNGLIWDNDTGVGMAWAPWRGLNTILSRSRMMIRAVDKP